MDLEQYPLWTALITPFLTNGKVDYPSLEKLLKNQEAAKIGILLLGSTGEALNLDIEEQKDILNFAIKKRLKVPLMVGVGGINLPKTLEWVEYLESLNGIHSYLMVTPLYSKPGLQGQYHWFKSLLDAATKPCVLYNVPSRSGCPLSIDAIKKLENHSRFWGIKEASGELSTFKKYRQAFPKAKLFCGDDAMMPTFSKVGAFGLISVAANAWAAETRKYVDDCLREKLNSTEMWVESCNSLFSASNPVPVKALLHHLEVIETPYMRAPLSHLDMGDMAVVKTSQHNIKNWFNS